MTNLITPAEATELNERHISTRGSVLNTHLGYEDMNNFYFSIDEMKDFIKHVEDKSDDLCYENIGVRIFLGAYPANGSDPSYSTVFLSATRDNGAKNSKEINPMNFAGPGKTEY